MFNNDFVLTIILAFMFIMGMLTKRLIDKQRNKNVE